MKTYLTALLSFLIAPILALAALDVTLSGSTVISVGGYSLVVSGSGNIDSISVDTSSFSVILSPGATLTVTSADRKAFTVSPSNYTTSQTCSTAQSLLTIGMASGSGSATTVTITPSSTNCTLSEGGIVGGGGGGGGGGGSVPTPVYTVIPGTASSASSQDSSVVSTPSTTKIISTSSGVTITITKTLKVGSQNSEVKALQQALAQDKTIYPEGLVTGYYGPATTNAIKRFQKKYGLEPVGFVGPLTRKKLNEVYGTTTSTSKTQQIQAIQQLINQLLEQIKILQAKKTQ